MCEQKSLEMAALTAVRKGEFQKEIVTQKLTPRGLLGWCKCPKSVVRKIVVAWPLEKI